MVALAVLSFAGALIESHGHQAHSGAGDRTRLPTFVAGHDQPDHTVHVEEATHLEASSCVGCLHRHRQWNVASRGPISGDAGTGSLAVALDDPARLAGRTPGLPAPRAPPAA